MGRRVHGGRKLALLARAVPLFSGLADWQAGLIMTKQQNLQFLQAVAGIALAIVGIGYCQGGCREKAELKTTVSPANPFPTPQDDAELMMSKFGLPDVDDSTDNDKPRPPLVTRLLTYRSAGVKAGFLCGGKVGDPPPCGHRWGLIGFTDVESKTSFTFDEAMTKLKPLLRDDAPQKQFRTAGYEALVKQLDDEIAKFKRAGIVHQVDLHEYGATLHVRPAAFLAIPMQEKRSLCNLGLERAKRSSDRQTLAVVVVDYRTEKEIGSCSVFVPFEMKH